MKVPALPGVILIIYEQNEQNEQLSFFVKKILISAKNEKNNKVSLPPGSPCYFELANYIIY